MNEKVEITRAEFTDKAASAAAEMTAEAVLSSLIKVSPEMIEAMVKFLAIYSDVLEEQIFGKIEDDSTDSEDVS